ncbi:MAG TPA: hypothetical protein VKR27_03470 [Acidimicrobiales bacterium]|nr:hypothetical protein [Acidimicrobiales bacterium]
MDSPEPFEYLTSVVGTIQGHLVAGRLRSEGVNAVMRGTGDGPYPFPTEVAILVPKDQLATAREILLKVQVEAAFDDQGSLGRTKKRRPNALGLRRLRRRAGS